MQTHEARRKPSIREESMGEMNIEVGNDRAIRRVWIGVDDTREI